MIKSNEQLLNDNVMDRIMSTSITSLDQNLNANDVDVMDSNLASYPPPLRGVEPGMVDLYR